MILAGGIGSRLSEETEIRPKPMIEIGHRPILWHIMQHYSHFGFRDFVICLGYKGEYIKKYFSDTLAMASDLTIDFATHSVEMLETARDDWRVTLVDTGQTTQTAGRLERVRKHVGDETFLMTYGDGVSDVDLDDLVEFHRSNGQARHDHGRAPTGPLRQAAHRRGRRSREFEEKPQMSEGWINGGFFVLEPGVFDYIPGDVDWAREPLESLAAAGQLSRLLPRGVLAVHGHDARQGPAQLAVGQRAAALEALGARDGATPLMDDGDRRCRRLHADAGRATSGVVLPDARPGVVRGRRTRDGVRPAQPVAVERVACCADCTCAPERGEAKLVRCARGTIVDHVVDTRPWSPTFRRVERFVLDDEQLHHLYLPPFVAHGFQVVSDVADVCYLHSRPYEARRRPRRWRGTTPRWRSTGRSIPPILSARDAAAPPLADIDLDAVVRARR